MPGPQDIDRGRRLVLAVGGTLALLAGFAPRGGRAQSAAPKMPIGIVGAGRIGGTVGSSGSKPAIRSCSRRAIPKKLGGMVKELGPARPRRHGRLRRSLSATRCCFGVPYGAYPAFGRDNAAALKGKIVLDAGNAGRGARRPRSPPRPSETASASRRKNICPARGWCARSTR